MTNKKRIPQTIFCILFAGLILFQTQVKAGEPPCFTGKEEAVQYVRDQMKERAENVPILVSAQLYETLDLGLFLNELMAHTGNPDEGDTLQYSLGGRLYYPNTALQASGQYLIEFRFEYYDTAEQEAAAKAAIASIAAELELNDPKQPVLGKIRRIYNWISYSVYYDWWSVNNDDEHPAKFTA